jgi:uncharacterized protein YkwD
MPPSDLNALLFSQLKSLFPNARDDIIEQFINTAARELNNPPSDSERQELIERFQLHLTLETDFEAKPLIRINQEPKNDLSIEATQDQAQLDSGPFFRSDKEFPIEIDHIEERTVSIIEVLKSTFQQEDNFKQLCNKIYKGIKAYIQDPINPLYSMVPLLFEDLEHNEDIFIQLSTLCLEFGILIDTREKGIFLVFKVPDYVSCRAEYYNMLEKLLQSFRNHKDESISVKMKAETNKQKFHHADVNRDERVAAYLDAKNRRAAVSSQYPMFWTAPIPGALNPQEQVSSHQIAPNKYTDYPDDPSEVANEGPGLQFKLATSKAPFSSNPIANNSPAPFKQGTDLQSHIRQNYDAIEKRLQQGNKVKVDRSASKIASEQDSYLAQIQEYRNRVRNNNHHMIQKREHPKTMTWGELEVKADLERQEQLGRECLTHTNQFRQQHGLPALKWEPLMFQIGKLLH